MTNKYSQFHDGFFDGIWIDDKVVHVYVRTLEGERFVAVASDVASLSAGGFKAGNIIFDVVTRDQEDITGEDIVDLYDLRDGLAGEKQGAELLATAHRAGLIILEISPSYGGSCIILARSVDLMTRNEWSQHCSKHAN